MRLSSSENKLGYTSIAVARSGISGCYSRAVKGHLAIDQVIVRWRLRVTTFIKRSHDRFYEIIVLFMKGIRQKNGPEINVVVYSIRTMDDYRAKNTICLDVN